MKHKKLNARILSLALSVVMLSGTMPTTVFASEGDISTGTEDNQPVQEECSCDVLCTEDIINAQCFVCTVEDADLANCKGEEDKNEMVKFTYQKVVELFTALPDASVITAETTQEEKDVLLAQLSKAMEAFDVLTGEEQALFMTEQVALYNGAMALKGVITDVVSVPMETTTAERTTSLDLTSTISYRAKDGSIKTADPTTTSITDTNEGWSWDAESTTLTLDGLTLSVPDVSTGQNQGIFGDELTISLEEGSNNTITVGDALEQYTAESLGIITEGGLTINGNGSLRVQSGKTFGDNASSTGISSGGDLIITDSQVVAISGKTEGQYSNSIGIYIENTMNISGTAKVTATGGDTATSGTSYGIFGQHSSVISDTAQVISTASKTEGVKSIGVYNIGELKMTDDSTLAAKGNDKAVYINQKIIADDAIVTGAKEDYISGVTMELTQSGEAPVVISFKKKITFDSRNGSMFYTAEAGADGTITMPEDPIWEDDYTFAGWYTGIDGTGKAFINSEIAATQTVYAKWTKGAKTVRTQMLDLDEFEGDQSNDAQGWDWNSNDAILTLNDVNINVIIGDGISGTESYKILLNGENSISSTLSEEEQYRASADRDQTIGSSSLHAEGSNAYDNDRYGVFFYDNLIINGSGSLYAEGTTYGIGSPDGALTIEGGTVTGKGGCGIYASSFITINAGTVSAEGNLAIQSSDDTIITAQGEMVTGANEDFESGVTTELNQKDSSIPVVISFGPSINVAAQTGTATYGTEANPTFEVTASSFGGNQCPEFEPSIEWTGTKPTGVKTTFSLNKYTITTTAATPAGEYEFKVVSAKKDPETGNYESAEATLKVDKRKAAITWGNTKIPFNGSAQVPTATVSNTVGSDVVTVSVTGEQTNIGENYIAIANGLKGAAASNYKLPDTKPQTTFSITKAAYNGPQATAIDASKAIRTNSSITLDVQTIAGETVEYGYSTTADGSITWQDDVKFTDLSSNTEYYFFARVKENNAHMEGAASLGTIIKTEKNDTDNLKDAIIEANNAKSSITVNNNPASTVASGTKFVTTAEMDVFTDAIAAAQAVANKPNTTEEEIKLAMDALNNALKIFNDAIKTGTYSSGGGSSSGESSTPPVVVLPPSTTQPNLPTTVETKVTGTVDEKGNATVHITDKVMQDAIDTAVAEAKKNGTSQNGVAVVFRVNTGGKDANTVTVNLNKSVQEKVIAGQVVNTSVVVDNPDIAINMNLESITEINKQAKADVQLFATRLDNSKLFGEAKTAIGTRSVFDLKVTYADGSKAVTSFGTGRITVEIPYVLQEGEVIGGLYAVNVDENGKVSYITNSSYDAKSKVLRFETNHFGVYGIGYKETINIEPVAAYGPLSLFAKAGKTSQKLSWKEIKGADGYLIYGVPCGAENKLELIKTVSKGNNTSYTHIGLKSNVYYKYQVKAYRMEDGKKVMIEASKTVHSATTGGRNGNPVKITGVASSIALKEGEKKVLTPKITGESAKNVTKKHVEPLRYESSNKEVVSVGKDGTITGKKAGKCNIYVYAQNGLCKIVKINVK